MKLIHPIKALNIALGLVLTMQIHSMQITLKNLSDPVKNGLIIMPTDDLHKKTLIKDLDKLNALIAKNRKNSHPQEDYRTLIIAINKNGYMADSIEAWKINRLAQYTQSNNPQGSVHLNHISIAADKNPQTTYFYGPVQYDQIQNWKKEPALVNNPKYLIFRINQFFCKGCPIAETAAFTKYIKDLVSINLETNAHKKEIESNIKKITENEHFQEVCQFMIDGVNFETKDKFMTALNKISQKQYGNANSKQSFFNGKTLISSSLVLGFIIFIWCMIKNRSDFLYRTSPSPSLHV